MLRKNDSNLHVPVFPREQLHIIGVRDDVGMCWHVSLVFSLKRQQYTHQRLYLPPFLQKSKSYKSMAITDNDIYVGSHVARIHSSETHFDFSHVLKKNNKTFDS